MFFIYCRDTLCQRFQVKIGIQNDLHQSTLSALADVMLAQATECYYEKATSGI